MSWSARQRRPGPRWSWSVTGPAQLCEAGGMFAALVRDRDGVAPELTDVRRLRLGEEGQCRAAGGRRAIDAYEAHGRISRGQPGRADRRPLPGVEGRQRGRQDQPDDRPDLGSVSELNARARADGSPPER